MQLRQKLECVLLEVMTNSLNGNINPKSSWNDEQDKIKGGVVLVKGTVMTVNKVLEKVIGRQR